MSGRISRRVASGERGLAFPVTLMVLAIMSIISAYAFASALQVSDSSNADRSTKRAFQAAETGLQVATYRINNLSPLDGQCVTTVLSLPIVSGGCTDSGQLADGATWEYHMTPVLFAGKCAGYLIDAALTGLSLAPRCITATGTVNGVKRRTQARVVLFKGAPLFPVPGIICLTSCEVVNAAQVNGTIASNGSITLGNSSTVTNGIVLAETTGSLSVGNSSPAVSYRPADQGGFVLSPVEVGNTAAVNDNGAWTVSSGANFTYNATPRQMTLTSGTLTLQGGTYNLCSLTIGSNAQVVLAANAKARIFIDSPERVDTASGTGSGCATGTGYVDAQNNFVNPGNPEDLQLYVYGTDPPGRYAIEFKNAAELNMAIHAPRATVYFKNQANLAGGVNANKVIMKNTMSFDWGSTLANLTTSTTAILYQRTAWRQCHRVPTTSDPTSGC